MQSHCLADRGISPPRAALALLLLVLVVGAGRADAQSAPVPSPETHLGYRPGADYHLAPWDDVVQYFDKVDRASDRVKTQVLGKSTEGRPFMVAVVSSEDTIAHLDRYKDLQAKLSDPRKFASDDERRKAVAESKPVVVIACSIHSTETASTFMAMELLHTLATQDAPAVREILDRVILVLIPSVNPDGVEKVARWYERSKGKPWEGGGLPELYHKYAGHDTNRDWFMLNLEETRLVTRMLYRDWHPTLLYDVHQMGSREARMFVPPFHDPVNPNLDPRVHQGIFLIGAHMAGDLATAGKRGVLTNAMYDNWWNGGNRTTPQRHNIVAVLTEAAGVRWASPIFIEKKDLRADSRGFRDYQPAVNFVDPWPGGWWRLRDIVDYELVTARSLLTLAARYRELFQGNLAAMAADSIERGKKDVPFAWVVPRDQRDAGTAAKMVRILHDTGIEVESAREPFKAAGLEFPAGAWILPASQPYRPHLKDMMERQVYPTRMTAAGKAEAPYDVAGWTLPLMMGVKSVEIPAGFNYRAEKLSTIDSPRGGIDRPASLSGPSVFAIANTSNDDFVVRNALLAGDVDVRVFHESKDQVVSRSVSRGELVFAADDNSRKILDQVLPRVSTHVREIDVAPGAVLGGQSSTESLKKPAIALYQPWMSSMDEGWTRLTLEKYGIPYTTVHNAEVRSGALQSYRVLLIPSIDAKTLRSGYGPDETEPPYVGGLGDEGIAEIRRFVRGGGRLVCLDASTDFAIEALGLPVKNVVKGLPTGEFYAPGSVLGAVVAAPSHRLVAGAPEQISVYFDESRAFETTSNTPVVIANYATTNTLESGWLLGAAKIAGKAAMVEVPVEKGHVVLFGFKPQHRSQTYGSFRLLFNAVLN